MDEDVLECIPVPWRCKFSPQVLSFGLEHQLRDEWMIGTLAAKLWHRWFRAMLPGPCYVLCARRLWVQIIAYLGAYLRGFRCTTMIRQQDVGLTEESDEGRVSMDIDIPDEKTQTSMSSKKSSCDGEDG